VMTRVVGGRVVSEPLGEAQPNRPVM
jgi:hypothetical protein